VVLARKVAKDDSNRVKLSQNPQSKHLERAEVAGSLF